MDPDTIFLGGGVVATGLVSGLLYGWTVSVIPGLRRTTDVAYVGTMQSINRAIINPAFIVPFLGVPLVLAAAAFTQFRSGDARRGWLLAASTVSYVVGVLGVTVRGNIPLNDALDAFPLAGSDERETGDRRRSYERAWVRWHHVRTIGGVGSFVLAAAAASVTAEPA